MDAEIREDLKRAALMAPAYRLSLAQRLICPREEAVRIIAEGDPRGAPRLDEEAARSLVGACARHGLLAGEDALWSAPHQTVQEHFAALALRERWQAECAAPVLRRQWRGWRRQDVAALAAGDWWTETFVQLAGMLDAGAHSGADRLAQALARVNPWLAW